MEPNNPNKFLVKKVPITSYFTDLRGELSIPSLFLLFQEAAWEHASINGFGYNDLDNQGLFWVLSRIHAEINEMPKWTDSVVLRTWPSGTEGAFALRDFTVENEDNKRLISATSSWLIVDIESRRPKRPNTFKERMPLCESFRATENNAQKIRTSGGTPFSNYQIIPRIADIDVNGHINNTKYIEWAINSFPMDFYLKNRICELSINYLAEGFCDEMCSVITVKTDERTLISEITRDFDKRKLCTVQFCVESK